MIQILDKMRKLSQQDNGVSLMWVILGLLIAAAAVAIIITGVSGNNTSPSTGDYTKYLGNTNRILSTQNISDAQNKFANGGKIKTSWKPSQPIIGDQYTGNLNAKVVVTQYEDFACSACTDFQPATEKIESDYANKSVLFIYRNFSIGQSTSTISEASAQAAYVASGNNMKTFWTYMNKIYAGEKCVEGSDKTTCQNALVSYAKDLGINTTKFNDLVANFATNGIQDKLNRDKNMGNAAGVTATPTWFITGANGTKQVTGGNESEMTSAIDAALKASK